MNKKKWIILAGVGVPVLALLFWLLKGGVSEESKWRVIPEKAAAIAKIDFKQVADWYGNGKADFGSVKKLFGVTSGSAEGLPKLLDAMKEKHQETGLDLANPAYGFIHKTEKSSVVGAIIGLKSAKSWKKFVTDNSAAGTTIENIREIEYVEVQTGIYFAWNDEVLLFTNQPAEARDYFVNLLENRKFEPHPKSLIANLQKLEGGFCGIVSKRFTMGGGVNPMLDILSEEINKDAAITFVAKSEKGKFWIETEEIQNSKEADDKADIFKVSKFGMEAFSDLPTGYLPAGVYNIGVDFSKLVKMHIPVFDELTETDNQSETEELERCFTGDFSAVLLHKNTEVKESNDTNQKQFSFYKDIEEQFGLFFVVGLAKDYNLLEKNLSKLADVDGNIYAVRGYGNMLIKNGKLYVSKSKELLKNIDKNTEKTNFANATLQNISNQKGNYLYLNPELIGNSILQMKSISISEKAFYKKIKNRLEFEVFSEIKNKKAVYNFQFKNKSEDGFKQFVNCIESIAEIIPTLEKSMRRSVYTAPRIGEMSDMDAMMSE